jgi:MFS family permease
MPLLASTVTRDPLALAVVSTAAWLPWLLVGLLTGALVDRWDRRTVMWRVDAVRAAVVGVLVALIVSGRVSIPLLAALAFVLGVGQTLYENATQAIVPAVIGRGPHRRDPGPVQPGPGPECRPIASLRCARGPEARGRDPAAGRDRRGTALGVAVPGHPDPRGDGRGRQRRLRGRPGGHGAVRTGRPRLDALGYGLLLAAVAVGVLPGSLIAPWLARTVPTAPLLVGGIAAVAVLQAAFGLAPVVWVAVAAEVLAGVVYIVFDVAQISLRQELVPDRLIGRVLSAARLVGYGAIPAGTLLGGLAARALGLRAPFILGGLVLAVLAVVSARVLTTTAVEEARAMASGDVA